MMARRAPGATRPMWYHRDRSPSSRTVGRNWAQRAPGLPLRLACVLGAYASGTAALLFAPPAIVVSFVVAHVLLAGSIAAVLLFTRRDDGTTRAVIVAGLVVKLI